MSNNVMMILAVLAIIFGMMIVWGGMKRPSKHTPEVEVEQKDGIPILPRNARILARQTTEHAISSDTAAPTATDVGDGTEVSHSDTGGDALSSLAAAATAHSHGVGAEIKASVHPVAHLHDTAEQVASTTHDVATPQASDEYIPSGNAANFSPRDLPEFEGTSPVLDAHFYAQAQADEVHRQNNSPLHNCQQTVTLVLTSRNNFDGIAGECILRLARDYALKYGELNMFHRYEHPEGVGDLWFSVLGVDNEGVSGFDLLSLPEQRYRGLAFFLSLPHPHALKGFDSMVSVAQAIAKELDAELYDEQNHLLGAEQLQSMRVAVSAC